MSETVSEALGPSNGKEEKDQDVKVHENIMQAI